MQHRQTLAETVGLAVIAVASAALTAGLVIGVGHMVLDRAPPSHGEPVMVLSAAPPNG